MSNVNIHSSNLRQNMTRANELIKIRNYVCIREEEEEEEEEKEKGKRTCANYFCMRTRK